MNNSKNKREIIFETAKHLYYQNGFQKTSMDEIANHAGVQKTLVQYHFITKANLGNEIYGDYSLDQYRVYEQKVDALNKQYSPVQRLIAYTLKTVEYLQRDEKAFRFYREFFSVAFEHVTARLEEMSELTGLFDDIDPVQLHAAYIGVQYALRGIIYHYIIGEIRLNGRAFDRFLITMMLSSGLYGQVDVDETLRTAYEINAAITISFGEDFRWS